MYIKRLTLKNFRNYEYADVTSLSPGMNIICGRNAQGKTNLIEAIGYLSTGRSFRDYSDARLIREGERSASLAVEFKSDINSKIDVNLYPDGKKSIRINGIALRRISELLGNLCTVVFAPEDLKTLKENPGHRRRFLNMELSKLRPSYYIELQRYNELLKSKNRSLKDRACPAELIRAYNEQLADSGAKLIAGRAGYIEKLAAHAAAINNGISGEALTLKYKSSIEPDQGPEALMEKFVRLEEREREYGQCLTGPHKEDMLIFIDGRDSRLYCSQGQQRTAMLSLKLAAGHILRDEFRETPVYLLDDVFSELDEYRQRAVMDFASDSQVFITATSVPKDVKSAAALYVENGTVNETVYERRAPDDKK